MKQKVVAVLPAYQAAGTIVAFLRTLPQKEFDRIIISDDASRDGTFEIAAKQEGVLALRGEINLGYGGNMKRSLTRALREGADIIVEIHPDGEYLPDGVRGAVEAARSGAGLVLGNRFIEGRPRGMYRWKYYPSRWLTSLHNALLGTDIPDFHQGFRVYSREFLEMANFEANDNDYAFTFEIILQALSFGQRIASVPVTAIYRGEKRGASFWASVLYVLKTFSLLGLYLLAKYGVRVRFLIPLARASRPSPD